MPIESGITPDIILAEESPAQQRRIARALAHALDIHDAEHVGAWGEPDEDGCPFC